MAKVIIAGGGTGGHVFPAIAIARALADARRGCEVVMVGTERGLETRLVPEAGLPLVTIPVAGLKGKSLATTARNAAMLPRALAASWGLVTRHRPDAVVGVGGYASGPVVAAAVLRRVPTLIHEQNMIPGSTNRWLAPFVSQVALTFEETRGRLGGRGVTTGNPVRREFAAIARRERGRSGRRLLIFGGSQGAAAINKAMAEALPELAPLRDRLQVIHQAGKSGVEELKRAYAAAGVEAQVVAFIDRMAEAVEGADLILARAGATTVAELTAAGRGAILIPLPTAIHDHQTHNAMTLARAGAARVIPQAELTGSLLAKALRETLESEDRLDAMAEAARKLGRPDAAERIAALVLRLVDAGAKGEAR